MPRRHKLLAWMEPSDGDKHMAAFVGGSATGRVPATRTCVSPAEGRRWVESEAAALGTTVEWVEPMHRPPSQHA